MAIFHGNPTPCPAQLLAFIRPFAGKLPRLLERQGAIFASAVLGVIWFAWHLPLYIASGKFEITLVFFSTYLANNVAFSFIHTWFFLRSGGSALLAIVLHTAGNYSVFLAVKMFPGIEQSPATQPIYLGILVAAAILAGFALPRLMIGNSVSTLR